MSRPDNLINSLLTRFQMARKIVEEENGINTENYFYQNEVLKITKLINEN